MDVLAEKKIIVGVTGGIAAYKVAELVRTLKKSKSDVIVIMTRNATKFVTPLTFETLSQREVAVEMFPERRMVSTRHVELAYWADLLVIAPATANIIGKIVNGLADDLLSTVTMATTAPVLFAPAMEDKMWTNKIVQQNVAKLQALGYKFVGPESGELASGRTGTGRLTGINTILEAITSILGSSSDLSGTNVLVTAGRTEEDIDPVRFLTNRSSGKMGYALAEVARKRGARVTLISGPSELVPPAGVTLERVRSAEEMLKAVERNFDQCNVLLMAAAVADYRPLQKADRKIKKSGNTLTIELKENPDILAWVGTKKKGKIVVGFALETENDINNAKVKLVKKNLDLIILNNPLVEGAGFGIDTNVVTIIDREGKVEPLKKMSKLEVAEKVIDRVKRLIEENTRQ